ncbi:DUF721 domain-containing protein [Candidatus Uhrbacteria bacterium]|nr:DUF721 domain-containing protein [Candidatus Uhrbacteria bacterium]
MSLTPIRDLLTTALKRANVSTQVNATQVVTKANEEIARILPQEQNSDARAVSLKDNILTIESCHSSTAQFVSEFEQQILNEIKKKFPEQKIIRVRYRISKTSNIAL